jgi:hypothetical protein
VKQKKYFIHFLRKLQLKLLGWSKALMQAIKTLQNFAIALLDRSNFLEFLCACGLKKRYML